VHLGLYDLLQAISGSPIVPTVATEPDDRHELYWWAMAIADRSRSDAVPLT
jgi:hypothetical protein